MQGDRSYYFKKRREYENDIKVKLYNLRFAKLDELNIALSLARLELERVREKKINRSVIVFKKMEIRYIEKYISAIIKLRQKIYNSL